MEGAGPSASARETYLSVTLSASRSRLAIKGAGGGQVGAAAVLVRELHAMRQALSSASLQVEEWLDPRGVAQTLRTAYVPDAQVMLATRKAAAAAPDWTGVDVELAGPAYAETGMGVYQHDGAWTVSYQVRGWPQSQVYATFLQPLLRPRANARRSLSLVYEPLAPAGRAASSPGRPPRGTRPASSGPRRAGTRARTSAAPRWSRGARTPSA